MQYKLCSNAHVGPNIRMFLFYKNIFPCAPATNRLSSPATALNVDLPINSFGLRQGRFREEKLYENGGVAQKCENQWFIQS